MWTVFDLHPQRFALGLCGICLAMLAFGLYLQHVVGLEPCPMCIVQRYALIAVSVLAAVAAAVRGSGGRRVLLLIAAAAAVFGAFVAARQSWLQWYPPEFASCSRDFYGMIETFPLKRALPMIFRGSGDCTKIDWTLLGASLANWSFIAFTGLTLALLVLAFSRRTVAPTARPNGRSSR